MKKGKQKPRIDDRDALAPHKSTQPHLDGQSRGRGSSRFFHLDAWRALDRGAVFCFLTTTPTTSTSKLAKARYPGTYFVPLSFVDFATADQPSTRTRLHMPESRAAWCDYYHASRRWDCQSRSEDKSTMIYQSIVVHGVFNKYYLAKRRHVTEIQQ